MTAEELATTIAEALSGPDSMAEADGAIVRCRTADQRFVVVVAVDPEVK